MTQQKQLITGTLLICLLQLTRFRLLGLDRVYRPVDRLYQNRVYPDRLYFDRVYLHPYSGIIVVIVSSSSSSI